MTSPLVSCIMPTHNRRRFLPLAVRYFLRQAYEPRELIVVDDGDDPVADLMPQDPRVRYVRLDRRHTVGAKRNSACRLARGELIVHWDDDDWMADWRLTYQVGQLLERDADLCGLDRLLFLDARQGQAWQYVYPRSGKPWLAGGTLCYRREFWQRNQFPDLDVGEDNRFVWSGAARRLLALPDNSFYVAMIHDGNTSPKRTHGIRWQRHPIEPLRKMLGNQWAAYVEGDASAAVSMTNALPLTVNHSPFTVNHSPAITINHSPHVTVSLPYYNCRRYLLRAVHSILAQTHSNLTLVVVNDGDPNPPWDLLAHIDDPRLVRYDLGVNRGRYFVDAVILAATPDPYLLIQDADDWSEPERVAALLDAVRGQGGQHFERRQPPVVGAVSACRLWREGSRQGQLLAYPGLRRPLSERFEFRSDHHGLFRSDALSMIGGNYGGYRIGYDTLLINLLSMLGEVAYVERPLYHRQVRAGSLTTSQATGMRSPQRRQVRNELAGLYTAALRVYRSGQDSGGNGGELAAALRALCQARVSDRERAEIERHAARLRPLILASQEARQAGSPAGAAGLLDAQLRQWLHDPRLPWSSWSVTPAMAHNLAARLCDQRPRRILEAGSGVTTALLARYAELTGAEVVTLEHDPRYFRQTAILLDRFALRQAVDLRLAALGPLRHRSLGMDSPGLITWYRPLPEGPFDLVFIDGPPQQMGRAGALPALAGQLSVNGELWLHDGHRQHEQECLAAWQRRFSFDAALVDADKGAWVLRNIRAVAG